MNTLINNPQQCEGKKLIEVFPTNFFNSADEYMGLYKDIINLYEQNSNSQKDDDDESEDGGMSGVNDGKGHKINLNRIFS